MLKSIGQIASGTLSRDFSFSLEEEPNPKLNVTRKGIRPATSQHSEVRIVSLPDAVKLVPLQRRDVERERVSRREALREWNMEEVQRQTARLWAISASLTRRVHVPAYLR